ncbi:hypothetical protein [Nocardioides litoris]|uniref:hypothetical protein n=1 Tax=Nocardioides litoris TaxID=1926648 RepID=UPI00112441C2|nr:hypothetical protein [Nocardioides litoris]
MADQPDEYDVVLLVEQPLTPQDARQVRSLHEGLDGPVTYHVLLPVDDAAARVEASLGSLSGSELLAAPHVPIDPVDLHEVSADLRERATTDLAATVAALETAGATVGSSALVTGSPVDELTATVQRVDGREAIVLTAPHVVAELFRLDWSSQARRKLDVPVLHLLEHETFDEQAAGPDGISGA